MPTYKIINPSSVKEEIVTLRPDQVFIDFFDTVVTRNVHPEDVKKIACQRIAEYFDLRIEYQELYRVRADIERRLCLRNAENGYDLEFNFVELTEHLKVELENKLNMPLNSSFCELAIEIELDVEKLVQKVDPNIIAAIKTCEEHGIPVTILSDFYLPSNLMWQLMEFHEIATHIADLVVSADYLITKKTGRLYGFILNKHKLENRNIVMIGDNFSADGEMAHNNGLTALCIDRAKQRAKYHDYTQKFSNANWLKNNLDGVIKKCDQTVFPEIVYTLYLFIKNLYISLIRKNVTNVFFLAREGQFLKKLFDEYQEIECSKGMYRIKTHYLCASRRSTFLPSLKNLEEETFDILFRQYRVLSTMDFLVNLGFNLKQTEKILSEFKINANEKIDDFPTSKIMSQLRNSVTFKSIYEESRQSQKEIFSDYIKSFGVNFFSNSLVIVDVGWKGTIQDNLAKIIKLPNGIDGFYLGLVAPGNTSQDNRKTGLLFDYSSTPEKILKVFDENRSLFEVLLGADHGSTVRYSYGNNNKSMPILEESDWETRIHKTIIQPLQNNIYKNFHQVCQVVARSGFEYQILQKMVVKWHSRIVFYPTKKEIEWFEKMAHMENFGVFEVTRFNQYSKCSLVDRLLMIKLLLTNRQIFFANEMWPRATLKYRGFELIGKLYSFYRTYNLH